ncbi:hypothetical protein [Winogradskyella sp. SYSU M77433]|uniref:hypothetical protein n=1 Tax=Winogradskyella sp. SYSU M77433 TaxID=3042722 RepID=UPI00248073A4|nr:hypothetical protein [Winogradskyella sp. SYSU M77433]MDH7913455.1 hypothetical protein [Winogradskyella sp. SYSU M77433]
MRNLKTIKLALLFIGLVGCNESAPQTLEDIEKFKLETKKDNLRTMFLGAINLCSDIDYSNYLDNPRSNEEYKKGGNCCSNSVQKPYISLAEYYVYAMDGDRSISINSDNPFKLKEIRKQWQEKIEKAEEEAKDYDSKALVYKGFRNVSVNTYDVPSGKLIINQSILIDFGGRQGNWYGKLDFRYKGGKSRHVKDLDISADEAEKLFDYFEENKTHPKFPPSKQLNTIITYALEKPEPDHRLGLLIVNVKKVEFYYPNGWDNKVGEIVFK